MKKALLVGLIATMALFIVPVRAEAEPITIGLECNYAPFNWTQVDDSNGAVPIDGGTGYCNGYDIHIATIIAEGLNRSLVVKKIEWDGLEIALKTGVIDLIIAGMSPTPERAQSMTFSEPYFESDLVLVVKKDSVYANATSIQDFSGAKVIAQKGTFHDGLIDQIQGVQHLVPMNDYPSMTVSLNSGRIDAITAESIVAKSIVTSNSGLTMIEFEKGKGFDLGSEIVSAAVAMRQQDFDLHDDVNAIVSTITEAQRDALVDTVLAIQPESMPESFLGGVFYILEHYSGFLIYGVFITLLIALVGTLIGFISGLLISTIRNVPVLKYFVNGYIEILRGTPMIVQAMLVFYGLSSMGIHIPTIPAGLLVVSVNTSAYMAEIIRGGIQSVDIGQFEGASALGMSHFTMMRKIILPQAIKNTLPAIGNEFIVNIKDTSVLSVISVSELFFQARTIAGIHYRTPETFFIVSIIYLILTLSIAQIIAYFERRLSGNKKRTIVGSQSMATIKRGHN